jgi:glutamate synthase (NADPH/NADH) small chain
MVITAIGTNANPILGRTSSLALNERGYIVADADGATSLAGVFAGGDIVTGAATVIRAMGAGRRAAARMKTYLGLLEPRERALTDAAQPLIFGLPERQHGYRRIRVA